MLFDCGDVLEKEQDLSEQKTFHTDFEMVAVQPRRIFCQKTTTNEYFWPTIKQYPALGLILLATAHEKDQHMIRVKLFTEK